MKNAFWHKSTGGMRWTVSENAQWRLREGFDVQIYDNGAYIVQVYVGDKIYTDEPYSKSLTTAKRRAMKMLVAMNGLESS